MLSAIVDREAIAFGEAVPTPMRMTFANHRTSKSSETTSDEAPVQRKPETMAQIVARLRGDYHSA